MAAACQEEAYGQGAMTTKVVSLGVSHYEELWKWGDASFLPGRPPLGKHKLYSGHLLKGTSPEKRTAVTGRGLMGPHEGRDVWLERT